MKVIQVYHPLQDSNTEPNKMQCIDGEYPHWCVKTENVKVGQTYQEWLMNKKVYCEGYLIPGIYLYDIMPVYVRDNETALTIRYAYIIPKDKRTK